MPNSNSVIVKVPELGYIKGEDGFSPVVKLEDIDHGRRLTITDLYGEHVTDILDGATAYEQAKDGGFPGTEAEFNEQLATFGEKAQRATDGAASAAESANAAANSASGAASSERNAAASQQAAARSETSANTAMNRANEFAKTASTAATNATAAKTAAETAQEKAEDAQAAAEAAKTAAQAAQTEAEYSRNDAIAAANAAGGYSSQARQAVNQAQSAMNAAQRAATAAEAAQTAAVAAKTATETARDTAITTLQTEGAAQRTAIQQKGAETLASIPEDYTDLSGDVSDLKSAITQLNGDQYITVTGFTGTFVPATGVTASIENGKLKLYGTSAANRRFLCLNGQKVAATTATAFEQTLPKGSYNVAIEATGYNTSINFQYTTTTFDSPLTFPLNGTFNTNDPVMVGLFISKNANYGTSENPTYIDVKISYYAEKANKETVDSFMSSTENLYFRKFLTEADDLNDITESGWYINTSSHVPANAPYNSPFNYLILYKNNTCSQIAILASADPYMHYRCKTTSGWGSWVTVPKPDTRKLPTFENISDLFTNGVLTAGTYALNGYTSENSPIMVKMQSMYTTTNDSDVPYVTFESRDAAGGRLYFSHQYEIDSNVEYKQQEWRIPNNFITDYVSIIITVPEGSTLAVKSFDCKYVPYVEVGNPKIIFHAHRGLEKFWPAETYNSVLAAAEMGFKSCIVIPKFTSDGVAVCFHNDGGSASPLNAYLKEPDGSEVPELQDTSVQISDFTYAELMQWSMGAVKKLAYADEKILKMDDFLAICAKTGMRPIFSIHPTLTDNEWSALKVLIDKYGLANQLSVKDGDTITWTRVINAFGDGNIYSIICLSSSAIDAVSKISSWRTSASAPNTRVDVEWMNFDPNESAYVTRTREALAAGHIVSAVLRQKSTGNYIKACIDNGITEFTNERHCSMGLNW